MSLIKFKMMYFEIKWGNYLLVCYHAIPFQNDHERHRHTILVFLRCQKMYWDLHKLSGQPLPITKAFRHRWCFLNKISLNYSAIYFKTF